MKMVFTDIPMKKQVLKFNYKSDDNPSLKCDKDVTFVVNSLLSNILKKDDEVKVVLLKKTDIESNSDVNEELLKHELNELNKGIGAKISFVTIVSPFVETRIEHEKLLRKMIDTLENDAEIYADITYGAKPLPIIMFNVLSFAERFFNATIKNVIYGKVDFRTEKDGKTTAENPVIYDVTPLYFLNELTNTIECDGSDKAVKMLDAILSK